MSTPAHVPATFQAPPADPQTPPPGYTHPGPAPAPAAPVFQQPPATTSAPAPAAAEPLAAVASAALQAEAAPPAQAPQVVTVHHHGQAYTVPASREQWPLEILEFLEEEKLVAAVRTLLGPQQWARFKRTNPMAPELGELWQAIGKAVGFEGLGES